MHFALVNNERIEAKKDCNTYTLFVRNLLFQNVIVIV